MKLFQMKNWELTLDEEIWGLLPFKKLLDRDKSKEKEIAHAEMLFIWYYCDIKSDFLFLSEKERTKEIKKEINALPKSWKIDKDIKKAIDFYKEISQTTIQKLYKQSLKAAQDVGNYLENTDKLLNQLDGNDKPVYKINDITKGLKDVKIIMKDLREAEKEVIKESKDNEGKSKGKQKFNTFEKGL